MGKGMKTPGKAKPKKILIDLPGSIPDRFGINKQRATRFKSKKQYSRKNREVEPC